MAYRDVPAFIAQLRECNAIAAMALEFCILTATRSGEVYGARWSEIDVETKVWTLPAARMKAAREHRVPLSERALVILEKLGDAKTSDNVFPSPRGRKPLSHVSMAKVMHRLQINGVTVHGFRSAFRDWAGNETHFPREVAEAPDRGEGGRYLLVPPGYNGPLPDSGFHVARSKTTRALYASRAYLTDNDLKPAVELIKKTFKIYPYTPGGFGTSIATALEGKVRLAADPPIPATKFVEASGKSFNTIPPNDFSFFEMINANIQQEPADSYHPELAGQLAAIGIVKGKPFNPDARMRKILTDAAAVGNAAGRALNWRPSESLGWSYYPGSAWANMLWQGGANFETPPPMLTKEGFKPLPPTGARTLDSRTAFYYGYTLDSPAMIMRLPGVGSQYLMGFLDGGKKNLDGGKTYKVTLPKGIPAEKFWSFTVYDNQTRSMLQTPQRYPRAGSQSYPSPAAEPNADGSTTVYFGPKQPEGVKRGNWVQDHARQGLVDDPTPLQPARTVLHEGMAAERDRIGSVSWSIFRKKPALDFGFRQRTIF
jgi:hypothetical protein